MTRKPNQVTGANARGLRQLPMQTHLAARVAQFSLGGANPKLRHYNLMKMKSIIAAAACAMIAVGCCTTPQVTQWEYKVVSGEVQTSLERNINSAASEGWQVVSASKYGGDGNVAFVVLRRAKK